MLRQIRSSLSQFIDSFAKIFIKFFSFVFSPGILFAQILFYGPKAVFHAKVCAKHEALTRFQTFLRKTLLGRFLFKPLLLVLLSSLEILLKFVGLIFWPVLFVVGRFERLVPRNGDVRRLTPQMRYHMWLMRRTFWH